MDRAEPTAAVVAEAATRAGACMTTGFSFVLIVMIAGSWNIGPVKFQGFYSERACSIAAAQMREWLSTKNVSANIFCTPLGDRS